MLRKDRELVTMVVEQSSGEAVVFKWGELQAGGTQSSTLMASSELFVHSASLGRELEFFPAGKQALKGKVLPDSLWGGCVPGSRFRASA